MYNATKILSLEDERRSKLESSLHEETFAKLLKFCEERLRIWDLKENRKASPPWTEDAVLKKYKFTNLWRQDDKTTKRLHTLASDGMEWKDALIFFFCGRLILNLDTIDRNGLPKLDELEDWCSKIKSDKAFKWGDAYMVLVHVKRGTARINNFIEVCLALRETLLSTSETNISEREIFNLLKELPNIGNFIAYEIILDLWQYFELPESFVHIGPGARPVLRRLFPSLRPEPDMIQFMASWINEYANHIRHPEYGEVTLRVVEGACCELRKYLGIIEKPHSRKRIYKYE